ncbi:hypothetical protein ACQWFX_26730, partial [Salmonella enterica subsp. enterica serovar Infantis]
LFNQPQQNKKQYVTRQHSQKQLAKPAHPQRQPTAKKNKINQNNNPQNLHNSQKKQPKNNVIDNKTMKHNEDHHTSPR